MTCGSRSEPRIQTRNHSDKVSRFTPYLCQSGFFHSSHLSFTVRVQVPPLQPERPPQGYLHLMRLNMALAEPCVSPVHHTLTISVAAWSPSPGPRWNPSVSSYVRFIIYSDSPTAYAYPLEQGTATSAPSSDDDPRLRYEVGPSVDLHVMVHLFPRSSEAKKAAQQSAVSLLFGLSGASSFVIADRQDNISVPGSYLKSRQVQSHYRHVLGTHASPRSPSL